MDQAPAVFVIAPVLQAAMFQHATESLPNECCGLLGGQFRTPAAEAQLVIPVANALASRVRFRMQPEAQLKGFQTITAHALELVAIYHSHPAGPAYPSQTDVDEFLYPGTISIILSPSKQPGEWLLHAFWIWHRSVEPVQVSSRKHV